VGTTRFCGGVILNANHILTAGSCVLDENNHLIAASQLVVRAGDLTLGSSAIIPVLLVYVHPTFNPFTNVNDLAVLRTAANINLNLLGLEVARINHDIVADTTDCMIAGWNVVGGAALQPLQYLVQSITNRDNCNAVYGGRVVETMICAGGIAPTAGVCPVVFRNSRPRHFTGSIDFNLNFRATLVAVCTATATCRPFCLSARVVV
jgi:trypsin